MIEVYLHRAKPDDEGTLGIFKVPELAFLCYAIELPDRQNERNYSFVNAGRYLCKWVQSTKYGNVPLLYETEGRSGILLHSGNYAGDARKGFITHSQGCILLGEKAAVMNGQTAVLNSKSTILAFDRLLNKQDFYININ